mgnify:CR=1 FL=1
MFFLSFAILCVGLRKKTPLISVEYFIITLLNNKGQPSQRLYGYYHDGREIDWQKTYLHFTSCIKMGLGKESFYRACQSIPKTQAIYQNTNLIAVLQ